MFVKIVKFTFDGANNLNLRDKNFQLNARKGKENDG